MTQTVIITGASAGIGRAAARLYGERGASVALIARGQAGLDGAVRDVEDAGGKALAIPCDVAEVAARGVLFAADHPRRRQYWVGATTAATVTANKFLPALLDRYLARTGYDSQQTSQEADDRRPDNLYQPVDGPDGRDHGAHGIFDARSHARSAQLWLDQRPRLLSGLAAGAALAGGIAAARRGRRR